MTEATPPPLNPTDLLAEIARALADPAVPVTDLCALSEQATAAEAAAGLLATDARQAALDPALPPDRVAAALAEATAAAFVATRLASAREALDALVGPRLEAQKEAARQAARDHALAERDRMTGRLSTEYPDLHRKMIDLMSDLMAVNEMVDAANRDRRDGEPLLQRPEGMVRGFHDRDDLTGGGAPYNFEITRLTQMVLPDFENPDRLAWPPNLTDDQLHRIRQGQPHLDVVRARFLTSTKGRVK